MKKEYYAYNFKRCRPNVLNNETSPMIGFGMRVNVWNESLEDLELTSAAPLNYWEVVPALHRKNVFVPSKDFTGEEPPFADHGMFYKSKKHNFVYIYQPYVRTGLDEAVIAEYCERNDLNYLLRESWYSDRAIQVVLYNKS